MSEQKQPPQRKPASQDLANQNVQLQLRAGGLQYMIRQHQKDLDIINDQMRDLAIEYSKLKAQEDEVAKVKAEFLNQKPAQEAKPQLAESQSPKSVDQVTTQPGSEGTEPTPVGPDGQNHKKE